MSDMNNITQEILAERLRQVAQEGFDGDHDNEHSNGQLAMAAACYAAPEPIEIRHYNDPWPWDVSWDKRQKHDRRRQLVIAGALIVAEIERLDRAAILAVRAGKDGK